MVFDYWPQVEADFMHYYKIDDPLGLPWRRFKVLLRGLPPESRVHRLLVDTTTPWYDKLALIKGRPRPRTGSLYQIPGGRIVRT